MLTAIGILKNISTGRCHPILFREAPLPGPYDPTKPNRLKSAGHHTDGLPTLEDAIAHTEGDDRYKDMIRNFDPVEWDGEDIPASVAYEVNGELVWV